MLKKLMLLAVAAMAMFAVGAQSASATWYHGEDPLESGENPHITATGTAQFTSPNGGVHCPSTHATIQLTGGTTTAHIKEFTVTEPTTCEVSGGLVFLTGGTTTLKKAELTSGAQGHLVGHEIQVTGIVLHNEYHNGFALTLSSTATPASVAVSPTEGPASNLNLTGTLSSKIGNVTATAHLEDHDPTYGVTAG